MTIMISPLLLIIVDLVTAYLGKESEFVYIWFLLSFTDEEFAALLSVFYLCVNADVLSLLQRGSDELFPSVSIGPYIMSTTGQGHCCFRLRPHRCILVLNLSLLLWLRLTEFSNPYIRDFSN